MCFSTADTDTLCHWRTCDLWPLLTSRSWRQTGNDQRRTVFLKFLFYFTVYCPLSCNRLELCTEKRERIQWMDVKFGLFHCSQFSFSFKMRKSGKLFTGILTLSGSSLTGKSLMMIVKMNDRQTVMLQAAHVSHASPWCSGVALLLHWSCFSSPSSLYLASLHPLTPLPSSLHPAMVAMVTLSL